MEGDETSHTTTAEIEREGVLPLRQSPDRGKRLFRA